MDTQNTPVHVRLWNRDFWLLVLADLLLAIAVYMQMIYVPAWAEEKGADTFALTMGGYGIGLFLMGGFCSYLVQKYRRNRVCLQSLIVLAALMAAPALCSPFFSMYAKWAFPLLRLATGMFYGLVQMVLSSTLVIDCCEAQQRTGANYATAWFYRLALSLGPLAALMVLRYADVAAAAWTSAGLVGMAFLLIALVRFPFKSPEETIRRLSLDRFFLPQGWLLFFQLLLANAVLGLVMAVFFGYPPFFAWLMVGFLMALLAEKFVFVNAELKSEAVCGLMLMGAAVLLMMTRAGNDVLMLVPVMMGLGSGLIGSRFLLFFIRLSEHCKRGTSQSSFFLAWEAGIAFGMCLGFALEGYGGGETAAKDNVLEVALALLIVALGMYLGVTHSWYLRHRNR